MDGDVNQNAKDNLQKATELLSKLEGKGSPYDDPSINSNLNERSLAVKELEAVYDVPVQISAVLGRSTMPVHQLLKLGRGAVVELDRRVGEAVDIYVNNRLIARGEVVVVDEHLGVTMTEIIKTDRS